MASLLRDYPELGLGLEGLLQENDDATIGMVGIYTLLKLRLRSVVQLLPRAASDEEAAGGPAQE